MSDEILARIEERLKAHVERYERDREEITDRVAEDKRQQKDFRDGIIEKVDSVGKRLEPIERDHQLIVKGGKWIFTAVAGTYGAIKGWIFIKDHIK